MNYTPAEQRSRSADFDILKEKGAQVLSDPRVLRGIGRLGGDILAAWKSSFLPEVHHGVVSLPKRERFTNGFALLPLSRDELNGELLIDPSMYEPTLRRREAFFAAGGKRAELLRNAADCVTRWAANSSPLTSKRPAETFVANYTSPDTFFTTRPIIYVANFLADKGEVTVGRIAAHEAVHGLQGEQDTEAQLVAADSSILEGQLYLADAELEAYQTGAVILRAAGYNPRTSDRLDFKVAALAGIQSDRTAFLGEMVRLGAVLPAPSDIAPTRT